MQQFLLVGLGGALGSIARYSISAYAVQHAWSIAFPLGTWLVNAIGSLIIGVLAGMATQKGWTNTHPLWLLCATGFCGGFTTFSTFSLEAVNLLKAGNSSMAIWYLLSSVCICLLATWLGFSFTKWF